MNKWDQEKAERTRREIAEGRRRTTKAMMEGVLDQIMKDYGMLFQYTLICDDLDPRKWDVSIKVGELDLKESLWSFPTETMQAQLMLLKEAYVNANS